MHGLLNKILGCVGPFNVIAEPLNEHNNVFASVFDEDFHQGHLQNVITCVVGCKLLSFRAISSQASGCVEHTAPTSTQLYAKHANSQPVTHQEMTRIWE